MHTVHFRDSYPVDVSHLISVFSFLRLLLLQVSISMGVSERGEVEERGFVCFPFASQSNIVRE
jgi:hypothetical protein